MRVLGIETSTIRGTISLVEHGREIVSLSHREPNAHGERMLSLVERALSDAGWPKTRLDSIAVGVGPGSFTGLRVGIALARGIALGLDRPLAGAGSLAAMARSVPASREGTRWALLDARRGEIFVAAYEPSGQTVEAPHAVPRAAVGTVLPASDTSVLVGEVLDQLCLPHERFQSEGADLPHATWTARLAVELPETAEPVYVRDAGAILPNLPPSPLAPRESSG